MCRARAGARWSAILTAKHPLSTPSLGASMSCPNCGAAVSASSVLCQICLSSLKDVSTTMAGPDPLHMRVGYWGRARQGGSTRARKLTIMVLLILVVGSITYARYVRPSQSPPPPPPSNPVRSVVAGPDVWPITNADLGATRTTAAQPSIDSPIAWRRALGSALTASPVVDRSRIYVALSDARLVALSLNDGREIWSVPVPGQLDGAPTVAGDLLYAGQRDGRVVALEASTGSLRWSQHIGKGEAVFASPIVADGVVYALSSRSLVAFDAEDGSVLWSRDVDSGNVTVAPVIVGERLVVATTQGIIVVDRRTGDQTFWYRLVSPKSLATSGNNVIALSDSAIVSLDVRAKRPWWEGVRGVWARLYVWGLAPAVPAPPSRWRLFVEPDSRGVAIAVSCIHVSWASGALSCYDPDTGATLWEGRGGPGVAPPTLTGSGLLVAERHALTLLDPLSGIELGRRAMPFSPLQSVVATDDALLLATDKQELLLLR